MPYFKEMSPDSDLSSDKWTDIDGSQTSWSASTAPASTGGNINTIKTAATVTLSEGQRSGTKITGVTIQPGDVKLTWKFYTSPGTFNANIHIYINGVSVSEITPGSSGAPTWTTTTTYAKVSDIVDGATIEVRQEYKAGGINLLQAGSGLQMLEVINLAEDQLGNGGTKSISAIGL